MSTPKQTTIQQQQYQPLSLDVEHVHQFPPLILEHKKQPSCSSWRLWASFWVLGLLNNAAYVIMLACAKQISEGGTALVFLANILPSFLIKLSAPYWFDHVEYDTRLKLATLCMLASFVLVGAGASARSNSVRLVVQLVGVAVGSAQAGLGEASLLALAGKSDGAQGNGQCLTSFSSGTGMAGVFGFFWKWFWNEWLKLDMSTTLYLALSLGVGYWSTFRYAQRHQPAGVVVLSAVKPTSSTTTTQPKNDKNSVGETQSLKRAESAAISTTIFLEEVPNNEQTTENLAATDYDVTPISQMTGPQRYSLVLSLWPYMIPLFVVYAAEYALQSGTWTAIGFPVSNVASRNNFFEFSNWMYQAGVFLSRSSGTLFTAPLWLLWVMPTLQFGNLAIFLHIASNAETSVLYHPAILYAVAFYTGLLGGAVYISGYKRICADLPLAHREFALSATSVAESVGIIVADALGLVIQACLYQVYELEGAILACPIKKV